MRTMLYSILIACLFALSGACSKEATDQAVGAASNDSGSNSQASTQPDSNDDANSAGTNTPTLNPGEIPFEGFPVVNTTAKQGEYVLCPPFERIKEATSKDPEKMTFIFYDKKMVTPGEVESDVDFSFSTRVQKVPNAYLIPIPAGQTAQVGDIVLTWWQSGSGMKRAIVVEASNPKEPTVRYLDIKYDNPAKSRDGKTTIGQMDEKLKPDTFVKLTGEMEPGTAVAARDGSRLKHAQVIRVAGDKVLTVGFAGRMKVYNKADCTPVPLVPDVKPGDRVKAPFVGSFRDATVKRVDSKIGRVFVTFSSDDEKAIAFGDVAKSL